MSLREIASFDGVRKSYKNGDTTLNVLRGVSFSIKEKEMTAFVGASGCGKTTVLNILGAIDKADYGSVYIDGIPLSSKGKNYAKIRNEKIGFIFQTFNLIPVLTAYENVEIPFLISSNIPPKKERRERIMTLFERVGISDLEKRMPSQLSGGQQQRVAIARALVKKPSLILADEPTANLDSHSAASVISLMREMNEETNSTFVFATHDTTLIDFASRSIKLLDGFISSDERKT